MSILANGFCSFWCLISSKRILALSSLARLNKFTRLRAAKSFINHRTALAVPNLSLPLNTQPTIIMHNVNNLILTLLLIFCFGSLQAQRVAEFPDRSSDPRRAKALMVKKYDLFNKKKFKGFFFVEANYGLVGTFSRDETFTVSAPISLGVGYRFSSNISIGLRAGQSVYNSDMYYFDRTFETRAQTKFRMVTANLNAHLPLGLRGEAYGGFGIGYQHTTIDALEPSEKPEDQDRRVVRPARGFFGTAQIGARYALSPQISAQAEIGSGLSNFSVGLRYRLR